MLREILPPDTARAYPAMRELRTHLTDVEAFVASTTCSGRPATAWWAPSSTAGTRPLRWSASG